jgi:hypothetical protein
MSDAEQLEAGHVESGRMIGHESRANIRACYRYFPPPTGLRDFNETSDCIHLKRAFIRTRIHGVWIARNTNAGKGRGLHASAFYRPSCSRGIKLGDGYHSSFVPVYDYFQYALLLFILFATMSHSCQRAGVQVERFLSFLGR